MTNEECFGAWAPDGAVWSPWAKPVLFAQLLQLPTSPTAPTAAAAMTLPSWLPEGRSGSERAIIVNLPGADSVVAGLTLAARGYRPVPLYNGNLGLGTRPVVPTEDIARHLLLGAERLRGIRHDAPPAFLLDAQRLRGVPAPGSFDNRWAVLPQDFPSATFLLSHGVRDVLLLELEGDVDKDLAHVLLRWQQAGIHLQRGHPGRDSAPEILTVAPPSSFRRAWYRVIAMLGLRRSNVGGFGAIVPEAGSGGFGA